MKLIKLIIKGTAADAVDALEAHGLRYLATSEPKGQCSRSGYHKFCIVRIREGINVHSTIIEWFTKERSVDGQYITPFPPGALLFYSYGDDWAWYGQALQQPHEWGCQEV